MGRKCSEEMPAIEVVAARLGQKRRDDGARAYRAGRLRDLMGHPGRRPLTHEDNEP